MSSSLRGWWREEGHRGWYPMALEACERGGGVFQEGLSIGAGDVGETVAITD